MATLHSAKAVCQAPAEGCGPEVAAKRPLTRQATALPVVGSNYGHWLKVRLPGRWFGQPALPGTGWISDSEVGLALTSWNLMINRRRRTLTVNHRGHRVRRFRVVVGKPSTPTPAGNYFVEERLYLAGNTVGAPAALALSARSGVFQEFDGGPGQIGIHGTANIGGTPGTAVSHGCIRVPGGPMGWLAAHIDGGTPVKIR